MSQQTPVARVIPAWHEWLQRWPTPNDLASASPAEVLRAWDRMGYPRRALRLLECAQIIRDEWAGEVPRERADLLSLPGIGPYTADAILAFAYQRRSVVLDTNIRRVLARWHGAALPPPSPRKFELARADAFVPADDEHAAEWNAAIMEFGALVCTAKSPTCDTCPVNKMCGWFQAGHPEDEFAQTRTTQKWEGTNRQARGAIMGVLRSAPEALLVRELHAQSKLGEHRFDRAMVSLLEDGLITEESGRISLPH